MTIWTVGAISLNLSLAKLRGGAIHEIHELMRFAPPKTFHRIAARNLHLYGR